MINLSELPWLSFAQVKQLPKIPAIYLCLTPANIPVYIGETSNLYNRWAKDSHDKKRKCLECGCDRIAWLAPVPEIRFHRLPIERELIKLHRPILNMQVWNGLRKHRPGEFYDIIIPKLARKKKEIEANK